MDNEINNKINNQNVKILRTIQKNKMKRHVKEPQEPLFKKILNDFYVNYGIKVVGNTTKEIFKM